MRFLTQTLGYENQCALRPAQGPRHPQCAVASFHGPTVKGYENQCALRPAVGSRHPEQAGITSWVKR